MKIVVARTAGFCWGVKRAVDKVTDLTDRAPGPIMSLGPLIHNPQTLEALARRGVGVVDDPAAAKGGTLVVRTHGIPPVTRQTIRGMDMGVLDLTCPHVGGIQSTVRRYARHGYHMIVVGDARHAEVVGLMGYAEGRGFCVDSPEDVAAIPGCVDKVAVVAQSTHDRETYRRVCEAVRRRWPDAEVIDTLCGVTDDRQQEVRVLARSVDAVVVVGGKASANTARLASIADEEGCRVLHIETEAEIDPAWFAGIETVAVTAGASTPQWQTERVVERLGEIDAAVS